MKRLLLAILSFLYLLVATGTTMQYHYCMGELASWSILKMGKEKKCGICGMSKSDKGDNDCCKDEHKLIKLALDQKANNPVLTVPPQLLCSPSLLQAEVVIRDPGKHQLVAPTENAPPVAKHLPVHILHCTFRI
jgi:hypothetical protein